MVKHLLASTVVFLIVFTAQAQPLDCAILTEMFELEDLKQHLQLWRYPKDSLIIETNIDVFLPCQLATINARPVAIMPMDTVSYKKYGVDYSGTNKKYKFNVVVVSLMRVVGELKLHLWNPYTNANVIVEIMDEKGQTKCKVVGMGVY